MNTQFDLATRPQDDFYGHVNNKWLASHPIPPAETRWGTFEILRDNSWKAVHTIIEEIIAQNESSLSHDQTILRRFFESTLQFDTHRENHIKTLQRELGLIAASTDPSSLAHTLGRLHRLGLSPLFTEYVELDDKDSRMQVLRLHQAGLSLPNRDYYLEQSEHMDDIRQAYAAHLERVHTLLPELVPARATAIIAIETQLATSAWTDIALRDVQKNYTKMSRAQLEKRYTSFDWTAFFAGLGWRTPNDHIVVDQPTFLDDALRLFSETPVADLQAYLAWHLVDGYIHWISQTAAEADFEFFGKKLSGMKEMKPLWKRSVQLADGLVIGEILGREYALRHFPESSKTAVQTIVAQIRSAYHTRIDQLTWMQDTTKQRAHTKLDNINVFIGYPSVWKDISTLEFTSSNVIDNLMQARELGSDIALAKIGTPPPDEEWYMNAHTVNAYNHPNRLEIVFPAAILQPPFFDPSATTAANFGGIGAVVGHEFTHSFDDQGAQYDESGHTRQWISDEELAKFKQLAAHIVRQANAYETVPGVFLQGELILGEAIADIGGLELAVEAYQAGLATTDATASLHDLFVSFAQCECGAITRERAIEFAKTDPHPPSPFRVNCVVCHIDAFYRAYNVTESDRLYLAPPHRAQIW